MNERVSTEQVLASWRYGSVQAERLAAAVLIVEGYAAVDPQCPLGGPDDLKDFLCMKENRKFVGASYFPPQLKPFRQVKEKFLHDLEGVHRNEAQGLVFLTNQRLTPSQRTELIKLGRAEAAEVDVYHLERIRALLDAPRGYGIRLEFLRIPMTLEEQVDSATESRRIIDAALRHQTEQYADLASRVEASVARFEELKEAILAIGTRADLEEGKAPPGPEKPLPKGWLHVRTYAAAEMIRDFTRQLLTLLDVILGEMRMERTFSVKSRASFLDMVRRLSDLPLWRRNPVIEEVASKVESVGDLLEAAMDLRSQLLSGAYGTLNPPGARTRQEVQRDIRAALKGLLATREKGEALHRSAESVMRDWGPGGSALNA